MLGSPRSLIDLNVSSRFGEKYVNDVAAHGLVARSIANVGYLQLIANN